MQKNQKNSFKSICMKCEKATPRTTTPCTLYGRGRCVVTWFSIQVRALCGLCWLRLPTPITFIYTWLTITNQVAHSDTDNQCDRASGCGCSLWQWCWLTICGLMRTQYFAIRTTASGGAYTTPPGEYDCNSNKLQIVTFTMLHIYQKNNVYYISTTVYLQLSFVITICHLSVPAHM